MDYAKHLNEKQTPQSQPIPGSAQVPNSAGGFSWAVDDWKRLERFLILGSEGGSYYASERKLTLDNADAVKRCIAADGPRALKLVQEVSTSGRAPKNDPAILVLAACAKLGDAQTRALAYSLVPAVCRIGTHLFHFVQYAEAFGGWGRGMRKAVARWYNDKPVADLAHQLVKYQGRDGWTNRDLLRLSKPRKAEGPRDLLYHWATSGEVAVIERWLSNGGAAGSNPLACDDLNLVWAFERAKVAGTPAESVALIEQHRLPRECVRTEHLNSPEVWAALLPHMKPEALVRNLGKMTAVGLLKPMSQAEAQVVAKLGDVDSLRRSRIHPIKILSALLTYRSGRGVKGSLSWSPSARVVDALDAAFYSAFGNVTPSGARTMLALDVSGSMDQGTVAGVPGLTPRVAAAAMSLISAATEPQHMIVGFTTGRYASRWSSSHGLGSGLIDIPISPRQRLDDVVRVARGIPMGGTDCALPMLHALERNLEVDAFVVYTDNETWAGSVHPAQALKQYRQKTGIGAKLVVVGMVANDFSIADPNDAGMMDVVGFDTAAPQVISDFSKA